MDAHAMIATAHNLRSSGHKHEAVCVNRCGGKSTMRGLSRRDIRLPIPSMALSCLRRALPTVTSSLGGNNSHGSVGGRRQLVHTRPTAGTIAGGFHRPSRLGAVNSAGLVVCASLFTSFAVIIVSLIPTYTSSSSPAYFQSTTASSHSRSPLFAFLFRP